MPPKKKKKKETTTTSIRRSRPSKKTAVQEPKPSETAPVGDQAIAEAKVHDPGSTLISNAE